MYRKGRAFVDAAHLLEQCDFSEHTDYVFLHLLCQGMEILFKGLLLFKDFDHYEPLLKTFGHNLNRLAHETAAVYGRRVPPGTIWAELESLNDLYAQHLLRYASLHDVLLDPRKLNRRKVVRYLRAIIRAADADIDGHHTNPVLPKVSWA
jgi:hypothetical protein